MATTHEPKFRRQKEDSEDKKKTPHETTPPKGSFMKVPNAVHVLSSNSHLTGNRLLELGAVGGFLMGRGV
eukprot:3993419-Amphidinium_carterae.1